MNTLQLGISILRGGNVTVQMVNCENNQIVVEIYFSSNVLITVFL